MLKIFELTLTIQLLGSLLLAQIPSRTDVTSTPLPNSGHDYIHAPVETVNPANGSLSIRIGVPMPPSRGFTLPFNFAYDSNGLYYIASANGTNFGKLIAWATNKTMLSQGGWSYSAPMMSVQMTRHTVYDEDHRRDVDCSALTDYVMQDATGNRHNLGISYVHNASNSLCVDDGDINVASAGEGAIAATTTSNWLSTYVNPVTVQEPDGTTYQFPIHSGQPSGYACQPGHCDPTSDVVAWAPSTITDKNGNQLSLSSTTNLPLQYTDTIGRTALSISSFGENPDYIGVPGLGGGYQVTWTSLSPYFTVNLTQQGPNSCTWSGSQSSIGVIQSIALPNGRQFSFSYDGQYGTVNRITYPSGAYVRYVWGLNRQSEYGQWAAGTDKYSTAVCAYQYDAPAILQRVVFDGSSEVLEQDFSYATNWQSGSSWVTKQTTVATHDLKRGISYNTVYTYSWKAADNAPNSVDWQRQLPVESMIQYYGTDGALLRTVNKSWINERTLSTQQINENGLVAETDWFYDPAYWYTNPDESVYLKSEQVVEKDEYDYGSGSHGPLLRKTLTSYAWDGNRSDLLTNHILDLPYKAQVIDSDGVTVDAGVTYLYSSDSHANLTHYQQWLNSSGSYLDTQHGYDGYGNITSTTDPAGNTTYYAYADNFAVGCSPGVNASNAYLTQITYPSTGVAHVESFSYNCPSGKLAGSVDQNGFPTSYQYNDAFSRLTEIDYPNSGYARYSYNDAQNSVSETQSITSNQQRVTTTTQDGLGHTTSTQLSSDPEGADTIATTYDGVGLKMSVTNPYRGQTSDGAVQYQYDSLGRLLTQTQQDGSTIHSSYSGNTITVTDEAGRTRKTQVDGLGRLTNIWEDLYSLNYPTIYQYDALGNLKCVEQHGNQGSSTGCNADPSYDSTSLWRVRRFSYDMLSRLLTAKNPESGTYTYDYDSPKHSECSGYQYYGELVGRIDNRGIWTCMHYDALHRVTQKSYQNASDSPVTYCYDNQQTACGTSSVTNGVGRRTGMSDGSGNTAWSYDNMGRIATEPKTIAGISKSVSYQRNLDGSVSTLTYPDNSSVQYVYDNAGRPISVSDPTSQTNYGTNSAYAPTGALTQLVLGNTPNFSGITWTEQYNNRLQPGVISATSPTIGTIFSLSYNFGWGANDNGNVYGITNGLDSNRSQTFTYDPLNRLVTAQSAPSGPHCWGNNYAIDPWSNLYQKNVTQCTSENVQFTATNTNQFVGYSYDQNGNLYSGGTSHISYDAENRATGVDIYSTTYLYDGDGQKVKDSGGAINALYWYDDAGQMLAATTPGKGQGELDNYIYFGGVRIAKVHIYPGTTYISYYLHDHLGTARMIVDQGGNVCYDADYFPWGGEQYVYTNTCPQNYKFTDKERDPDWGADYFGARWYNQWMGRFFSPDWSATPTAVPYANFGNPQSLNLYSYVRNNPLRYTDPNGHCAEDLCIVEGAAIGTGALYAGAAIAGAVGLTGVAVTLHNSGDSIISGAESLVNSIGGLIFSKGDESSGSKEPPQLKAGKDAHQNEEVRPGEKAEVPTPSGQGRMDRYDAEKGHIREIKPDNPRGVRAGEKQLERYKTEMEEATGKPHTTELTKYPPPKPPKVPDQQ